MRHTHVQPVPPGMTPTEAFTENCTMGRLMPYEGEPSWAVIDCDGEVCRDIEYAPDCRRYYNDVLIDGPE